jgi:hypothetical protein
MKRSFIFFVSRILGGVSRGQKMLFRFVQDGKYGYIDKTGKIVIKPQFDFAESFSEGLAWVSISGKDGYINKTG